VLKSWVSEHCKHQRWPICEQKFWIESLFENEMVIMIKSFSKRTAYFVEITHLKHPMIFIIIIIIMKTSNAPLTGAQRRRTVHACT